MPPKKKAAAAALSHNGVDEGALCEEQRLDFAVKLFEMGVPEARVEKILTRSRSWEEALQQLTASERSAADSLVDPPTITSLPAEQHEEEAAAFADEKAALCTQVPKVGEMAFVTSNAALLEEECKRANLRLPKASKRSCLLGAMHCVESVDLRGRTTLLSTIGRLPTRALLGFGDTRAPKQGDTVTVVSDAAVMKDEFIARGLPWNAYQAKKTGMTDTVVEVLLPQCSVIISSFRTPVPIRVFVGFENFDEQVPGKEQGDPPASCAAGSTQRRGSPVVAAALAAGPAANASACSPAGAAPPVASVSPSRPSSSSVERPASPSNRAAICVPIIGAWRSEESAASALPIPCFEDAARSSVPQISAAPGAPINLSASSSWWRQAVARWPQAVEQQRQAILAAAGPLPGCHGGSTSCCSGVTSPVEAGQEVSKRRRLSLENSHNVALGTPKAERETLASGRDSLSSSVGRRSIATPQRRQSADSCDRAREIAIFTASPNAMRLNAMAEICSICVGDCAPRQAVRLSCHHGWYCHDCMRRYAEERLAVGAVQLCCPECSTPLSEHHLRKLLPTKVIERLLDRSLESSADVKPCPTPNCPNRVVLDEGAEPMLDCEICGVEHCLLCSATPYHEGLTCEEYAKKMARKRKKTDNEDHDASLLQWMQETGTKQCPSCRMAITKQNIDNQTSQYSECHKMCCRNCFTKFCFKCLTVLTETSTCSCSRIDHGFVDPLTGKRMNHIKDSKKFLKAKGKGKGRSAKTIKL